MRRSLVLILVCLPFAALHGQDPIGGSLHSTELRTFLRQTYYLTSSLGYTTARDRMYGQIDHVGGRVVCVYSGYSKDGSTRSDMNATGSGGIVQINTEHTWPQSLFSSAEPMQSDLHHLYPTWERPNGSRSNHSFGEIDDHASSTWFGGGYRNPIQTSVRPAETVIAQYSQSADGRFEPRADHKGDVARAMFYFWTMYETNPAMSGSNAAVNANFFNGMKDVLFKWHREDPADAKETARTAAIAGYQGNPNPYVLDSTLVRRVFFYTATSLHPQSPVEFRISQPYPNPFNPQTRVEITLPAPTELDVDVVDAMGRVVRVLSEGLQPAGQLSLRLDGDGLPSGLYLIRARSPRSIVSRRVVLVK
jgi:endonuclease I